MLQMSLSNIFKCEIEVVADKQYQDELDLLEQYVANSFAVYDLTVHISNTNNAQLDVYPCVFKANGIPVEIGSNFDV